MFTEFNSIVALFLLLPVTLNIVLPLLLLVGYAVIKVCQGLFAPFRVSTEVRKPLSDQPVPTV